VQPMPSRPRTTEMGRRNFERLVSLASADQSNSKVTASMADALAALLAEVTPMHREVLASKLTRMLAAPGRVRHWRLPPGMDTDEQARRKWAALMLLDCVDYIADSLSSDHSLEERAGWRERAKDYTQGAEFFPVVF
jgi:hypothetical protein